MKEKVIEIVAMSYNVPKTSVTESTVIATDLPTGSVHKIGIISLLEDEYDVSLSIRELDELVTVGDLINWVTERA